MSARAEAGLSWQERAADEAVTALRRVFGRVRPRRGVTGTGMRVATDRWPALAEAPLLGQPTAEEWERAVRRCVATADRRLATARAALELR